MLRSHASCPRPARFPPSAPPDCAHLLLLFLHLPISSVCEERDPDTACPFNSLPTFDTPSAEVSVTYFPPRRSFMPSSSAGGGRWGGGAGEAGTARAELLTPPPLSRCVKSPPFVRRHIPPRARLCLLQSVGGLPHTHTYAHTQACVPIREVCCG